MEVELYLFLLVILIVNPKNCLVDDLQSAALFYL